MIILDVLINPGRRSFESLRPVGRKETGAPLHNPVRNLYTLDVKSREIDSITICLQYL